MQSFLFRAQLRTKAVVAGLTAVAAAAALVGAAAPATAKARSTSMSTSTAAVLSTPTAAIAWSANLLTGDAAAFDLGTTGGWAPYTTGAVLANVASPAQAGTGALAVTFTGTGPQNIWVASGNGPASWTPVKPGTRYSASTWLRAGSVGRNVAPVGIFYDASGKQLTQVWGQIAPDTTTGWTQTAPVVGLAPAGAAYMSLALLTGGEATGEVHYVDSASITSNSGTPRAVVGPLQTQGNQIHDASGAVVTLRGIHLDGAQVGSSRFPTDDEVAHAHQWGANFIRIPLGEQFWLNTCTSDAPTNDPSYPSKVDEAVQSVTSRGMVAMLDLHWNVIATCGTASQHKMADAQYAKTFWTQVAARYRGNPLVAFDLYNEPHDISDAVWLDGGSVTEGGTTTYQAVGMQRLYDTVRRQGANNLVFTGGNGWSSQPTSKPVSGSNIVNSVHAYTCPNSTPPECTRPNPYDPAQLLDAWLTAAQSRPVVITEFGWPDKSDGRYIANVISYAEGHGWGWDVFAWDGTTSGLFDLLSDVGPYYEPAPGGMPVLSALAAN